jgi:hypothetical protein
MPTTDYGSADYPPTALSYDCHHQENAIPSKQACCIGCASAHTVTAVPEHLIWLVLLGWLYTAHVSYYLTITFTHPLSLCCVLLLLQGILSGCWVVSSSWVTAWLDALAAAAAATSQTAAADSAAAAAAAAAAAGLLVDESAHEVLGDSSGGVVGPARGRQRASEGQPALLQGQQVFIAGEAASLVGEVGVLGEGREVLWGPITFPAGGAGAASVFIAGEADNKNVVDVGR